MKKFDIVYDPSMSVCGLQRASERGYDFAHGCNTKGVMGSGVAAVVAKQYPALMNTDKHMSADGKITLGMCIRHINRHSPVGGSKFWIYNFYTQTFPGHGSLSYPAIRNCFKTYFKTRLEETDHVKLMIPAIGCGVAGGFRLKTLYAIKKALDSITLGDHQSIELEMLLWADEANEPPVLKELQSLITHTEGDVFPDHRLSLVRAFDTSPDYVLDSFEEMYRGSI